MNTNCIEEDSVIQRALAIVDARLRPSDQECIGSSNQAIRYASLKLATQENEVFAAVLMNSQNAVLRYVEFFEGTIDSCSVYPREIVKSCIKHNASRIILMHNHPSGFSQPSVSDKRITQDIVTILSYIDVDVVDHIIIAGSDTYSFASFSIMPSPVRIYE